MQQEVAKGSLSPLVTYFFQIELTSLSFYNCPNSPTIWGQILKHVLLQGAPFQIQAPKQVSIAIPTMRECPTPHHHLP